jgi:hypothetical protein
LRVVELPRTVTFIDNYEHCGDFGVDNADGASGRNLPNDTILERWPNLLSFCKQKNCLAIKKILSNVKMQLEILASIQYNYK